MRRDEWANFAAGGWGNMVKAKKKMKNKNGKNDWGWGRIERTISTQAEEIQIF